MPDKFVVYVEEPPDIRFEDGLVHIEDRSGNLTFHRVMRLDTFHRAYLHCAELMAKWQVDQLGKEVVRLRPGRKKAKH